MPSDPAVLADEPKRRYLSYYSTLFPPVTTCFAKVLIPYRPVRIGLLLPKLGLFPRSFRLSEAHYGLSFLTSSPAFHPLIIEYIIAIFLRSPMRDWSSFFPYFPFNRKDVKSRFPNQQMGDSLWLGSRRTSLDNYQTVLLNGTRGVLKWNKQLAKNLYCLFWFTCAIMTSDWKGWKVLPDGWDDAVLV